MFLQTVNSNLKRSEHELSELNTTIADINLEARAIAPRLSITIHQGTKKSPSPMRQKLLKGVPRVFLGGASRTAASAPSLPREQEEGQSLPPEACPGGQATDKQPEGQGSGLEIPEAQPGGVVGSSEV